MNFTVFDSRQKGIYFLWDETQEKKEVKKLEPVY